MAEHTVDAETVAQLLTENPEPVSRLKDVLPGVRRGVRDSYTIVRWITKGKDGVRLEGFRQPDGSWWSSRAALARFLARLSGTIPPRMEPGQAERERRAKKAIESMKR